MKKVSDGLSTKMEKDIHSAVADALIHKANMDAFMNSTVNHSPKFTTTASCDVNPIIVDSITKAMDLVKESRIVRHEIPLGTEASLFHKDLQRMIGLPDFLGFKPSYFRTDDYLRFRDYADKMLKARGGSEMPKSPTQLLKQMGVEQVIFNDKATIVILTTGEKGVAIKSEDDHFDPIIGFSTAYAMAEGTKGNKTQFKKLVNKLYEKSTKKKK